MKVTVRNISIRWLALLSTSALACAVYVYFANKSSAAHKIAVARFEAIAACHTPSGPGQITQTNLALVTAQAAFYNSRDECEKLLVKRVASFFSSRNQFWYMARSLVGQSFPFSRLSYNSTYTADGERIMLAIQAVEGLPNTTLIRALKIELYHAELSYVRNGMAALMLAFGGIAAEQVLCDGVQSPVSDVREFCRTALRCRVTQLLARDQTRALSTLEPRTISSLFGDDRWLLQENGFELCARLAVNNEIAEKRLYEEIQHKEFWRKSYAADGLLAVLASKKVTLHDGFRTRCLALCLKLKAGADTDARMFAESALPLLADGQAPLE